MIVKESIVYTGVVRTSAELDQVKVGEIVQFVVTREVNGYCIFKGVKEGRENIALEVHGFTGSGNSAIETAVAMTAELRGHREKERLEKSGNKPS